MQPTNRTLRTFEWSTVMTAIHMIDEAWARTPIVVLVDVSRTSVVPAEVHLSGHSRSARTRAHACVRVLAHLLSVHIHAPMKRCRSPALPFDAVVSLPRGPQQPWPKPIPRRRPQVNTMFRVASSSSAVGLECAFGPLAFGL